MEKTKNKMEQLEIKLVRFVENNTLKIKALMSPVSKM